MVDFIFLLYSESMELQRYVGFNTYSKALEQRAMPRKVMNTCCHNMTVNLPAPVKPSVSSASSAHMLYQLKLTPALVNTYHQLPFDYFMLTESISLLENITPFRLVLVSLKRVYSAASNTTGCCAVYFTI